MPRTMAPGAVLRLGGVDRRPPGAKRVFEEFKLGRAPSIQWYYKQWLGDQRVLGMDWDAKAMHFHLLMMSIQEEPPGSLPNDMALIRRWIGSPSDDVWRRVRPQVFTAWTFKDDRWFNSGMVETIERAQRYKDRYETGTKKPPDSMKYEEEVSSKYLKEPEPSNIEQATQALFIELGVAGMQNRVKCQDAIRAYVSANKCDEFTAVRSLVDSWQRYQETKIKYRTNVVGFLEKAVWKEEKSWTSSKSENSTGGW